MIILVVAPFILLIRGSMLLMEEQDWSPYMSLMGGAIMSILVLFIYFTFFYGRLLGKVGNFNAIKRRFIILVVIVGSYLIHGIFFFSSNNTNGSEVKAELLELHPILRLSLSTLIYLDDKLIVTDASRVKSDYEKMGLSPKASSKHFKQSDGFVHAVDLRTNGRSEFRNNMLSVYFKIMGFKTLRHVGTADHLHVSL